jgi:hypothetical protein
VCGAASGMRLWGAAADYQEVEDHPRKWVPHVSVANEIRWGQKGQICLLSTSLTPLPASHGARVN